MPVKSKGISGHLKKFDGLKSPLTQAFFLKDIQIWVDNSTKITLIFDQKSNQTKVMI